MSDHDEMSFLSSPSPPALSISPVVAALSPPPALDSALPSSSSSFAPSPTATSLSKKRLRPSETDARQRDVGGDDGGGDDPQPVLDAADAAAASSSSSFPLAPSLPATDSAGLYFMLPSPEVAAALTAASLSSSKRRTASDNALSSLQLRQERLQDLLQDDDSDDDSEQDDDDDDDEEEEKSPQPASAAPVLPPLASMAAAPLSSPSLASAAHPSTPAAPVAAPPLLPHPVPSLAESPSEFSSQLFVIYMPKSNFKRFIVSSLNTTIIRASKGEKQPVPRMNFPSLHTARPVLPPASLGAAKPSVSAAAAGSSALCSPPSSSSPRPSQQDAGSDFSYNVSMEDVLSCLDAHGVRFKPGFMWMDLSDFGARFVQQLMGDSRRQEAGRAAGEERKPDSNDMYGGLWYNVVHKSHLVVNHFAHPFLGEGYAVVITLDLLDTADSSKGETAAQQSAAAAAAASDSTTQTITVSNDTLYKATKNINEGAITAHPALFTNASNTPPALPQQQPQQQQPTLSAFSTAPSVSLSAAAPPPELSSSSSASSSSFSRRKVRPVESIGEMLDRIGEYQRIRLQVKSKNKACEKLGYSKGTINAYREKVKQALQLGIDLNMVRKTKYRDFKRVLAAAHQQQVEERGAGAGAGGGGAGAASSGSAVGSAGGGGKDRSGGGGGDRDSGGRDEGGRKRSNSFGDLGIALMAKQDAKNGRRKGKSDPGHDEERKRGEEDDAADDAGRADSASDSGRRRRDSSPTRFRGGAQRGVRQGGQQESGSQSSSPRSHPQHLQAVAPLVPSSAAFSPTGSRSNLSSLQASQVTFLQAGPHATYTTAQLPPGTTYLVNSAPQQLTATTFTPQTFSGYAQTQYGTVGTVYTTAPVSNGGSGGFNAGGGGGGSVGVMRAQNGATYQVVSSAQAVQMAQNVQQPTQATFTRFL